MSLTPTWLHRDRATSRPTLDEAFGAARPTLVDDRTTLTPDDFPPGLMIEADLELGARLDDLRAAVRDYERHHIHRVLKDCADDKREAARRLGLSLSSLYRKLEEIDFRSA